MDFRPAERLRQGRLVEIPDGYTLILLDQPAAWLRSSETSCTADSDNGRAEGELLQTVLMVQALTTRAPSTPSGTRVPNREYISATAPPFPAEIRGDTWEPGYERSSAENA